MSNFNQYFKNTGVNIIVDRFFNNVDYYNPDYKITNLKYNIVEEPPHQASYYIENGLTATHKVQIEYTLNDEDTVRYSEFEVPKEIDGAFIIEGAYRVSTNRLGSDYDCRIKMSGTGNYRVNFDFNRYYDIQKQELVLKKINPDLGISDKSKSIPFNEIDSFLEEDPKNKELLRLSDRQIKKLMIKLDLDYKPEFITSKLIQECLAYGDDRLRDLIIDKTIESVPTSFMQYIFRDNNGKNYYSARRRITTYFTKYNKLQDQITAITNLCFRFWKGTKDAKSSDLQVPPGVNAINLEAIGNKITIPESVAYNKTFSDLIDIADTPINNNTNLQNSLTVSTHITDDKVLFDVYNLDFQKITIEYIDYLNCKVCASEYVDYEKKVMKPNEDNMVEVKYRMGRRMVPIDEVQLIDLHPDYRLSETTRRIPFVNYTDSVRISMGTSMLKQSIPLINAEKSLVDTGNYEELENNILNEKFKYPEGVVKDITEDKVIIELPDGTETETLRRTAIQGINDVDIFLSPKVKKGQKVKEGDVITGAVGLEKDTYKAGLNTLVLFHAYYGLVNEDAVVISKSYSERIASYSIIDLSIDVKNTSAIKWLAPIGTKVKSKDSVVLINKAIRLDEINKSLNEKLGGLFGDDSISEYVIEDALKVPNNIDEAVVSDIMVQENVKPKIPKSVKKPDLTFSHTSNKVIEDYNKNKDRQIIFDKYPEYIASDTLDPINLDTKTYKVVYTIRVRLIKYSPAIIGEKLTSRYGGKGVVSKIVDDEKMPIVVDKTTGEKKRVEVVMNPYSTVNRKIPSVIMEFSLGIIAHKLHDMVDQLKKTKTGQKKILPLLSKYYNGRYDNMTTEEFIKLHESKPIEEVYYFNVGCFSDFTPEKIENWMSELGVDTKSNILMPETELTDLDELKENLSESEFNDVVKNMEGKFISVDKPLMVGYMTLERLYHIPSYSNKVTSSLFGVDINPKRDQPILGRGKYRETGQVIGEMELAVLLSRNAKEFIKEIRKDTAREDNQMFLNNLLGLGLTVTDSKGYNQGGSNLKEQLEKMKTKFRIKNTR